MDLELVNSLRRQGADQLRQAILLEIASLRRANKIFPNATPADYQILESVISESGRTIPLLAPCSQQPHSSLLADPEHRVNQLREADQKQQPAAVEKKSVACFTIERPEFNKDKTIADLRRVVADLEQRLETTSTSRHHHKSHHAHQQQQAGSAKPSTGNNSSRGSISATSPSVAVAPPPPKSLDSQSYCSVVPHRTNSTSASSGSSRPLKSTKFTIIMQMSNVLRETRVKLNSVRAGVIAMRSDPNLFKHVEKQLTTQTLLSDQHHKRMMDRDAALEKFAFDVFCTVGALPDAQSPDGYVAEGSKQFNAGMYFLLDDTRFEQWLSRLSNSISTKSEKVQQYVDVLRMSSNPVLGASSKKMCERPAEQSLDAFENMVGKTSSVIGGAGSVVDRNAAMECAVVENECFIVNNIIDMLGDVLSPFPHVRRVELGNFLKEVLDVNAEVRQVAAIPGWIAKPQLRLKMNRWRQKRTDRLQGIERQISQDMQTVPLSAQQKGRVKSRLMLLREAISSAVKITFLAPSSDSTTTNSSVSPGSSVSGGGSLTPVASSFASGIVPGAAKSTAQQQRMSNSASPSFASSSNATSPTPTGGTSTPTMVMNSTGVVVRRNNSGHRLPPMK